MVVERVPSAEKHVKVPSAGKHNTVPSAGKHVTVPSAGKHATSATRGKTCYGTERGETCNQCHARESVRTQSPLVLVLLLIGSKKSYLVCFHWLAQTLRAPGINYRFEAN